MRFRLRLHEMSSQSVARLPDKPGPFFQMDLQLKGCSMLQQTQRVLQFHFTWQHQPCAYVIK